MRIAWITDPHFNHVPVYRWDRFLLTVAKLDVDEWWITGDLSEGDDVPFQLQRLAESVDLPIRFVLGNHDFYEGSVDAVRRRVVDVCGDHHNLSYLTDTQPIELARGTWLIGEDGWGDACVGDARGTDIDLQDFHLIEDLQDLTVTQRNRRLRELGRQSAERLDQKLREVPSEAERIIVLTHVPPFREACWYEGQTTDDRWAPFFVGGQTGSVLRDFATGWSGKLDVLCGHTHHGGVALIGDNLTVHTGGARYGYPAVEAVLQIDQGGTVSVDNGGRAGR